MSSISRKDAHAIVKKAYASVAKKQSCCCCDSKKPSPGPCGDKKAAAAMTVPEAELGLSCGNPVAFAHVKAGDVVVDLGSGAGRDVFLAAEKVGAAGRAIGVDMTPEMLRLACRNAKVFAQRTGLENVEFRKGLIESLPIDDASVGLVISNCVINLSPDKPRVFREIFRVLRPGGRMVVSDIVLNRELPESVRKNERLYSSCLAGALLRAEYLGAIRAAGFKKVKVLSDTARKPRNVGGDPITRTAAKALAGAASSVTILAVK
jgi:ubiquinone/menaquinone biosynthesis C-methylase UbiE